MLGFELFDVSARISAELTVWDPPYNKVKSVKFRRIYEMASTTVPMTPRKFWADDAKHKVVSEEEKDKFFLRYHRSLDNFGHVYAFAHAIKNICDHGIPIFHQGIKVVDFLVLTNPDFEIGDICWTNALVLIDPISGKSITSLPTYENFNTLRTYPADVRKRLGIVPRETDLVGERPALALPCADSRVMPHMWIAAILEDDRGPQGKIRSMVHIDICAASYDHEGYVDYKGSLLSLKMFETPEYEIAGTSTLERAIKYKAFSTPKLLMLPHVRFVGGLWHFGILNYLPKSYRHFRCFDKQNSTSIEVTPLDLLVDRGCHFDITKMEKWQEFVNNLRLEVIRKIPKGTSAVLYNQKKMPELNGKTCIIQNALTSITPSSKRKHVAVSVSGREKRIHVSVYSLGITKEKTYRTLDNFARKADRERWIFSAPEDDRVKMTKKMMGAVNKDIEEKPEVASVLDMLTVGKPGILTYSKPFFKDGLRQILERPLCCIVSKPMTQNIRNILKVLNCNRAEEALNILKVIKMGKQKLLENDPNALLRDGSVVSDTGTDFHHLMTSIQNKISSDAELKHVFDLMGQYNIFPVLPWN